MLTRDGMEKGQLGEENTKLKHSATALNPKQDESASIPKPSRVMFPTYNPRKQYIMFCLDDAVFASFANGESNYRMQ